MDKKATVMYQPVFCQDAWPEPSLPPLSSPPVGLSAGTGCPSENNTRPYFIKKTKEKETQSEVIRQCGLSTTDTDWT